jgi:DNA-binding transcriptional ArsR family regulator
VRRLTVERSQLTSIAHIHNMSVMEQSSYGSAASRRLNTTFAALANPTRRAILARLASGEVSVSELAEPFAMTQPAISRHLRVLERAGLISSASDAQRRPRKLDARPLAEAADWLEEYRKYWEASFLRLDGLLGELKTAGKKCKRAAAKLR